MRHAVLTAAVSVVWCACHTVPPPSKPAGDAGSDSHQLIAADCDQLTTNLEDGGAAYEAWDGRGGVRQPRFTSWTGKRVGQLGVELGEMTLSPDGQKVAAELRSMWVSAGDTFIAAAAASAAGDTKELKRIDRALIATRIQRARIAGRLASACRNHPARPKNNPAWLSPQVVAAALDSVMDDLFSCYENGVARDPALEGRLVLLFAVDRAGRVGPAEDLGDEYETERDDRIPPLPDDAVRSCVLQVVESLTLPAPGDGVLLVTYPVDLTLTGLAARRPR